MPQEERFQIHFNCYGWIYTRYAWCVPLKNKKGETVANAFH